MLRVITFIIILILGLSWVTHEDPDYLITEDTTISELLFKLDSPMSSSKLPDESVAGASAERGRDLVINGFATKANGKKTKKQSKHFVCTSCHNVEREDEDLSNPDPLARLNYTNEVGLPFLQGTTLYGAVNRDSFYNDDYYLKYGDLIVPARDNIREAIQLCAVECAQGRRLKAWEVESILKYLWTIELKVKDLQIAGEELDFIQQAVSANEEKSEAAEMIRTKYLDKSPATFSKPPIDRSKGYDHKGDPDVGKLVYENSCLHCHKNQRYSFLHLDETKMSTNWLKGAADNYYRHSIYQVIRWGVKSKSGKESYMPQYPQEKMSDQMVEDLRAYFESR